MSTVETVRGPVDVGELGPTQMHEHILVADPGVVQAQIDAMLFDNPRRFFSRAS